MAAGNENQHNIQDLLEAVRRGEASVADAARQLQPLLTGGGSASPAQAEPPFEELGYAKVDLHRARRHGAPEVIFCQGKTPERVVGIMRSLRAHAQRILASRAAPEVWAAVRQEFPDLVYYADARIIGPADLADPARGAGLVLVVAAGTSDMPVAEEALLTARACGARAESLYDVGVAGLHRLLAHLDRIHEARALVVCAGMEGALPSVVGGLAGVPVIAVPTSVGYGASFGGLAALLGMLNSCASNVTVVNIDNGFGAGYVAAMINRQSASVD